MKSSTKRLLSLVIVLAMALSMLPMVSFAAAPTTLYVKPNANWLQSNARFAAYFFGAGEKWVDCTDADGDGIYEVVLPTGGYTHIIFCRMNPGNKTNNWTNKWNQTSDLKLPTDDSKPCYVVAANSWDKGAGQWVAYTPEGGAGETEPTTASPIKYSVAGEAGLCGSAWTPEDINNMMLDEDGDGIYTITYTEIAAGSYKFKVTDGTWNNSWPAQDYALKLEAKSNVTISFDTAAKAVKVDVEALEEPPVTEPTEPTPATYIVAGVAELCGSAWTPADTKNLMADEDGDGIYSITYTAIKAGTYQFKVTDGTWDNCWGGTAADGNYEFTLVADADVTINFNSADNSIEVVSDGLGEEPTEPTEPSEPFVPGVQEYALVGYINGADYGCNDDYENVGEYIFVDGKLTTSFSVDSYIFIKTTDNAKWYLAEAFCQDTTCTFVKDATEKMYVPANLTLTFTLVENENGTITVSYEAGEASPDEPVEPPVTEPTDPSEPDFAPYYVTGTFNGWDPANSNYIMNANGDGTYSLTVAVTAGEVQLKVTDGTWDNSWGDNGRNFVGKVSTDCDITITFDPATFEITVEGFEEKDPVVIDSINIAGAAGLTGFEWDPVANAMTYTEGFYVITFENVAAGTYEFKYVANGNWTLNWTADTLMESGTVYDAKVGIMGNSSVKVEVDGSSVTLMLDLNAMDPVSCEGAKCSAVIEAPAAGVTVSGAVTTGKDGDTTVELLAGEEVVATATVSGKTGTYSFDAVTEGTYTLKVSKLNHVAREYTVTVAAEAVTQDVKIHLIGDIDGNGLVNMGDISILYAHIKGTKQLSDAYQLLVANINGGSLNLGDFSTLYAHINGTKKLY